jgi:phosphoribosyl 1,2-cyclic phosphodiesterase
LKIGFYGVRGSIASPGPDTVKFGGNTSCTYVQLESGQDLIIDAGTGIRRLGSVLLDSQRPITILLSHWHWDHIEGLPFFKPLYQPGRQINILAGMGDPNERLNMLSTQMDGARFFPVSASQLSSNIHYLTAGEQSFLQDQGIHITMKPLNHPGGGRAFRLEEEKLSFAYVSDNEIDPPDKPRTTYDDWVAFCQGVDVLVHDAQYLESDMPHKRGWGHSLVSQVRQLALDAGVGTLVLFHHDPDRNDSDLEKIQRENDVFFKNKRTLTKSLCAWEGLTLRIRSGKGQRAKHYVDIE